MRNIEAVGIFDLETTGVDVENDRIVSACVGILGRSGVRSVETWIVNPGIPIPEAATAVHGITNEFVSEQGEAAQTAVFEIRAALLTLFAAGYPVVAYNACYDFTILDREMRRHIDPQGGIGIDLHPVLDPYVLDKAADKWRKGSRRLGDVAAHYGIETSDLHNAQQDAILAGRLAFALLDDVRLSGAGAEDIHRWSVKWRLEQQTSLGNYFREKGIDEVVRTEWPIYPILADESGEQS